MKHEFKRGDVYFADLPEVVVGSEQKGRRPVIIIQNDCGNHFSPTIIVACLTTSQRKRRKNQPTHVVIKRKEVDFYETMMFEHLYTIDKQRIDLKQGCVGTIPREKFDNALMKSLDLI